MLTGNQRNRQFPSFPCQGWLFLECLVILGASPALTPLSSCTVKKACFVDLAKNSGNNDPILFWSFSLPFPCEATLFFVSLASSLHATPSPCHPLKVCSANILLLLLLLRMRPHSRHFILVNRTDMVSVLPD